MVVDDGRITAVLAPGEQAPEYRRSIEANGRLLTPGLIDVHSHSAYVLGDSISTGGGFIARLSMEPDSIAAYRRWFAEAYLPYGVTTVRDAGSDETQLALLTAWMERPPDAPDFWPVGGALVSREEGRVPFPGPAVAAGPAEARRKVRTYHHAGLRMRVGLSQRALASRLEVYPKTVSRWERGLRRPSEEILERIKDLLE